MKRRIRLTESDIHNIVKKTVSRILHEGQGYQKFKKALKMPASTEMPAWKDTKEFITNGGADVNQPWGNYYDKDGDRTDRVQNAQGKIGQGFKHKLGRAAGAIGGLGVLGTKKTANKLGGLYDKWQQRKLKDKESGDKPYESKSANLDRIISEAIRRVLKEEHNDYEGNDLTYDSIKMQAEHVIPQMEANGEDISWRNVAEEIGLHLETLNGDDMELVKDAVEDAMMEDNYDGKTPEEFDSEFRSMRKAPCFGFKDGVIYVDYDPKKNAFIAGGATNSGIIPEYEFDVDLSLSLDQNLEGLYEYLIENGEEAIDW